MKGKFDVVISGAGVAGLLIASELSKSLKILVIESKDDLQTEKFWVTLKYCSDCNPHLRDCINKHFNQMHFSDAYENNYYINGDYLLWDSVLLLEYLKSKILENGGEVLFSQRFYSFKLSHNDIRIFANAESYSARLFIDCMGYSSPLILSKNIIEIKGYYLLNGAKLKLKQAIPPICLANVMLDKEPKYFEVFPTAQGDAYATMIYPTKTIKNLKSVDNDFSFIVKKSRFSRYFEQDNYINKLFGIVPIGIIKRKALDRVFFFGESAQSNPAATGTCLSRLLLNYRSVASFILHKVSQDDVSENALSRSPSVLNSFIRRFQYHTYDQIVSWDSDQYSKFISMIQYVDENQINKFLFGDLSLEDIFTCNNLKNLFIKRNFMLVNPFLKAVLNF